MSQNYWLIQLKLGSSFSNQKQRVIISTEIFFVRQKKRPKALAPNQGSKLNFEIDEDKFLALTHSALTVISNEA